MMMMGGDKKKMAQLIVASSMNPSADKNAAEYEKRVMDNSEAGEGPDGDLMTSASNAMKAFHAKDVEGLKDALYSFHAVAANKLDSADDDDSEEDESEA